MASQASRASAAWVSSALKDGRLCISVLGLGRIGLPTAALFAQAGARVIGLDINPAVVESINSGRSHFHDEPGLPEIVGDVWKRGKLVASMDFDRTVSQSDFVIISVPTPVSEGKVPDYSAVEKASHAIGASIQEGAIVIVESTVGPGTVEAVVQPIIEAESGMKAGAEFGLASCPERSDPGSIIKNMSGVPRIVGAINPQCCDVVAELYRQAFRVEVVKVRDPMTANAVKLTENLFRDLNIALANEFAILYEKLGIDAIEVIDACSTKYNFMPHYPGPGVGGPCLPSNPYYLISEGVKVGNIPYLIRMGREINDRMPEHVVELVMEALNDVGKTIRGSRLAILGVAYKPDVKDAQLSPVERIVKRLAGMGAEIALYDPYFAGEVVYGTRVANDVEEAVAQADCIVFGTAHKEFRSLDPDRLAALTARPSALVDSRNVLEPSRVKKAGFKYLGVGRAK